MQGRATLEMKLTLAEARENGVKSGLIKIVADGYNAPVTAGKRAGYSTTLAAKDAVPSLQAAACCLCPTADLRRLCRHAGCRLL